MNRSLPRLVALLAARYRPAKRLDIRRWYRACRLVLMPAARSVSSGLTVISSPATPRSNVSSRARSFTAVFNQSSNLGQSGRRGVATDLPPVG